ncbi:hypothetical protein CTAYLR_007403 [Chrysophaeum taylorii]|uniref:Uncharacterized protein n=1 Tax=Chrysophaeum taylorii TaxID=2483200 RepID=A0AAD7XH92_9STRA|nr:hypothetical protein CTAYLR_007403 [Chrysophaeum taylorii]
MRSVVVLVLIQGVAAQSCCQSGDSCDECTDIVPSCEWASDETICGQLGYLWCPSVAVPEPTGLCCNEVSNGTCIGQITAGTYCSFSEKCCEEDCLFTWFISDEEDDTMATTSPTPGAVTGDDEIESTWTFFENNGNAMPRHEGGLALCGGNLYLMGGREERTTDIFSLETYEYLEENGPNFTDISHFDAVTVGNEIWFFPFAGTYNPGEYPSDVYFRYNCEDDVLSEVPWDPFYARGAAATAYTDGYIYLIGGSVNGHYGPPISNVSRISVESGEWEELAPTTIPRDHAGAALVEDEIYLCAGRQTDRPDPQEDLVQGCEIYNIAGNYWRTLETTNNLTLRAGVGMVNWDGIPIVMGGETPDDAVSTVEALDIPSGTWYPLPDMVASRHGFGAVVTEDNRIWVCGGNEDVGDGAEQASCEVFPDDPR